MKVIKLSTPYPFSCPPCNVVMLFELPVENNKHPNFKWRGEGQWCGFCVLRTYSIIWRTMSQQFCHRFLLVSLFLSFQLWFNTQTAGSFHQQKKKVIMLLFIIFSMDFCLALTIIQRKNSLVISVQFFDRVVAICCLTTNQIPSRIVRLTYIYIYAIFFFLLYPPRIAFANCGHKLCKLYLI